MERILSVVEDRNVFVKPDEQRPTDVAARGEVKPAWGYAMARKHRYLYDDVGIAANSGYTSCVILNHWCQLRLTVG